LLGDLDDMARTLDYRLRRRLDFAAQTLDQLATRLRAPAQVLSGHQQKLSVLAHRLDEAGRIRCRWERQALPGLQQRLERAVAQRLQRQAVGLDGLVARLESVNPQRVLERGYAWISTEQGQPIVSVTQVAAQSAVTAVLADGQLDLTVAAVHAASPSKSRKR